MLIQTGNSRNKNYGVYFEHMKNKYTAMKASVHFILHQKFKYLLFAADKIL